MNHESFLAFYLDPTTGSIAFQAAIGGAVAAFAAVRIYWRRLKGLFRGAPSQPER